MAFNTNITPGTPPLLWSNVYEAFTKINENFDILVATVGSGSGLIPINFETLDTSVSPATDNLYNLGSSSYRWKSIRTAAHAETGADALNGLWAGDAQIKGIGNRIDLPANSTVDGDLIIDPDKTFFKEIQVDNDLAIVATTFGDTVNLLSGSGISLTVNSGADSIEIDNTGVLAVSAGSGVSVATVSGTATVTNTGVRSLTSVAALPSGRTAGAGINVDNSTGDGIKITNTGVISISNGVGITISTDTATGDVTITNSAPAGNTFAQVEVNGDSANRLTADAGSDVLNITSGLGITLSKTVATDTLDISVDPVFDLTGSVFADDSTKLVDAVEGLIVGNIETSRLRTSETKIALGTSAGSINQGNDTVAVGNLAGRTNQGTNGIAIGSLCGVTNQGAGTVAIGGAAGNTSQGAFAIAVGYTAGGTNQGQRGIAIGDQAGSASQGDYAVAIGSLSGGSNQGAASIAIGQNAGGNTQGSNALAAGYLAGYDNQGTGSIALGYTAAQVTQGDSAVSIGWSAGQTNQGDYAIAIGYRAGFLNQNVSSIILNASGAALNSTGAGFYVNPVRSTTSSARPLVYDASTSEIFYTSTLEFINSTISTSDSSGIIFDVQTTFNTDATFENDLTVAEVLTVKGSRVINLAQLQEVVAASADFTDFQARIAALV